MVIRIIAHIPVRFNGRYSDVSTEISSKMSQEHLNDATRQRQEGAHQGLVILHINCTGVANSREFMWVRLVSVGPTVELEG